MKTKILLFCFMLGGGLFSACQQEEEMQEILDEQEPVRTRSSCSGTGECLPELSISVNGTTVIISWYVFHHGGDEDCRYFYLSYSGTNCGSYGETITSSGTLYVNMPSLDYTISVNVSCKDSHCYFCEKGLKYISTSDGSYLTSPHDCHKEYNYVSGEIGYKYGDYILRLFYEPDRYGNSDKKMIPDGYRIVTYNSKTQKVFSMEERILSYPLEIKMPEENSYLTHYVRLFCTHCEYNTEHYWEYEYSPRNSVNFQEVNLHPKL